MAAPQVAVFRHSRADQREKELRGSHGSRRVSESETLRVTEYCARMRAKRDA